MEIKNFEKFSEKEKKKILKTISLISKKNENENEIDFFSTKILVSLPAIHSDTVLANLLYDFDFDFQSDSNFLDDYDFKKNEISEIKELIQNVKQVHEYIKSINPDTKPDESLKKMFVNISKDLRVILIVLARNIEILITKKNKNQAKLSQKLFSPIADILGIWNMKYKMDDLAFEILDPDEYSWIKSEIQKLSKKYTQVLPSAKKIIKKELSKQNIKYKLQSRTKKLFSIYNKIIKKYNRDISKLPDFVGIRIITRNTTDCYRALSVIHANFFVLQERFKDYISKPKNNGYQSLHTTVKDENGNLIEFQIRSKRMNELAEYGLAAKWKYNAFKNSKNYSKRKASEKAETSDWIAYLSNWKENLIKKEEEYSSKTIFVLTPNGDTLEFEKGATVLDLAFKIHSQVGEKCIGAKIKDQNKMISISDELADGDQIEIITSSKSNGPTQDWLKYAKTKTAISHIKRAIRKKQEKELLSKGEKMLFDFLEEKFDISENKKLKKFYEKIEKLPGYNSKEKYAISLVNKSANISQFLKLAEQQKIIKSKKEQSKEQSKSISHKKFSKRQSEEILIDEKSGINHKTANCCQPARSSQIIGFIGKSQNIVIHDSNCKNILNKEISYLIDTEWSMAENKENNDSSYFLLKKKEKVFNFKLEFSEKNKNENKKNIRKNILKLANNLDISVDLDKNENQVFFQSSSISKTKEFSNLISKKIKNFKIFFLGKT